jgi:hypothetical protein
MSEPQQVYPPWLEPTAQQHALAKVDLTNLGYFVVLGRTPLLVSKRLGRLWIDGQNP